MAVQRSSRCGKVVLGAARLAGSGSARHVAARPGTVGRGCLGPVGRGLAGNAWLGTDCKAGQCAVRRGEAGEMRAHHKHWTPPVATGPDLFEPPAQPVDTSLAAAALVHGHTQRLREAVYLYIAVAGARGMTAGEIANGTGINPSSIRPRLRELEGDAPWCRGKLPRRITRTAAVRKRMHVYCAL